jgi:hypothetical protein
MRSIKFRLPLWVAGGLLTVTATAAEPTALPRIDAPATRVLGQVDAPAIPNVPQEDAYQMRALPPQEAAEEVAEEPTRYLQTEFLVERGLKTYGWIDVGVGANNWGSPFNGPITFNDRNWQVQMNQLYLVNEKLLDTEDGGFDWGGRVDLLYGTDYVYTVARGLDANLLVPPFGLGGVPSWGNRYYGLAMPQLYGELGYGDHAVKFGHFYTIIGYEVVPAIGNFFYTHAYTMQYGEPFTHTGILDTWKVTDQFTLYGGITNGWDNYSDPINIIGPIANSGYPGANSNAAFLGGATLKSADESQALTMTVSSGNEIGNIVTNTVGNRSILSTVYINELTDKLTYVFQNDNGWQFNAGTPDTFNAAQPGTAQWYGINQYMFYSFSDTLTGGLRLEWFRDNNGYRVVSGLRNFLFGVPNSGGGYQGNFWEMTWGLNWKPNNNWIIRPELRYDWYSPDNPGSILPYGRNFDQFGQFYGGCDAIFQF